MEHQHSMPAESHVTDATQSKPQYSPPTIVVMSDTEVLSAFQVTQAATTWWVM